MSSQDLQSVITEKQKEFDNLQSSLQQTLEENKELKDAISNLTSKISNLIQEKGGRISEPSVSSSPSPLSLDSALRKKIIDASNKMKFVMSYYDPVFMKDDEIYKWIVQYKTRDFVYGLLSHVMHNIGIENEKVIYDLTSKSSLLCSLIEKKRYQLEIFFTDNCVPYKEENIYEWTNYYQSRSLELMETMKKRVKQSSKLMSLLAFWIGVSHEEVDLFTIDTATYDMKRVMECFDSLKYTFRIKNMDFEDVLSSCILDDDL